jgi:hypothetical protein
VPQTVHSAGDLPPTGADGCGVCAISTEVPGNIAQLLDCPSLNIGASVLKHLRTTTKPSNRPRMAEATSSSLVGSASFFLLFAGKNLR